jgi:hypothetical protein
MSSVFWALSARTERDDEGSRHQSIGKKRVLAMIALARNKDKTPTLRAAQVISSNTTYHTPYGTFEQAIVHHGRSLTVSADFSVIWA